MISLFHEIFEERKIEDESGEYVKCVECGKHIYREFLTIWNFSHDYSKNSHPEYKYDKTKISIRCVKCHQKKDFGQTIKVHLNN